MTSDLLSEVWTCVEDARRCYPNHDPDARLRGYLYGNRGSADCMRTALRLAVEDQQMAARLGDNPEVWSALTSLSRSLTPLTEVHRTFLPGCGPVERWLAVHVDLEARCFRVYEKLNNCDAETGYETCVATRATFDDAAAELNARASSERASAMPFTESLSFNGPNEWAVAR